MCIVFYTVSQPGYRLILAANRDEYLDRPALPAAWHTFESLQPVPSNSEKPLKNNEEPWVLCGRDLGSPIGGTWLGMTRDLRVGVLTNIRHPMIPAPTPNPPSRGLLLKSFLSPPPSSALFGIHDYLKDHETQAGEYEGFNLLLFDVKSPQPCIGYLSNRPAAIYEDISNRSGFIGLSNSPMSDPWPKVVEGEKRMEETLNQWSNNREGDDELVDRMLRLLSIPITSLADASKCTCIEPVQVGKDSLVPIAEGDKDSRWYGTRLSTVIIVKDDGSVIFVEKDIGVLDAVGQAVKGSEERRFSFQGSHSSN